MDADGRHDHEHGQGGAGLSALTRPLHDCVVLGIERVRRAAPHEQTHDDRHGQECHDDRAQHLARHLPVVLVQHRVRSEHVEHGEEDGHRL